jgi:hypothetical protein
MPDAGGLVSLVVVYLGGYLALVLLAVCLATGLYYIAELCEEYSRLTKRVLTHALRAVLALHAALLLFDRQPVACVLAGAAAHCCYARLLPRFPHFVLLSPEFGLAAAALLLTHALWLRHFYYDTYASAEYVAGFFVVLVWAVPFGFFISLAASDSTLPDRLPPFAAAAKSRDAAASRRAAGGALGGPEGRAGTERAEEGSDRKRSRNVVARVIGGALRWVQGKRGTALDCDRNDRVQ